MSANTELRALTGARGLAAWLVVGFHLRGSIAGLPAPVLALLDKGYLAVDFFFLLSGFVIWLSYAERLRAAGVRGIGSFLWRRLARIWPLHLAMLAAALALMGLLAATGRTDPIRFPLAELPLHLMLVQNWGVTDHLSWNDPAWSISTEFAAYLAFPWLVLAIDWRQVSSAVLMSALMTIALALHLALACQGAATLGADIPRLGLLRCLAEFAMGTMIAALWLRWRGHRPAAWRAGALFAALAAAWVLGLPETLAIPLAFTALLFALALSAGTPGHVLEGRAVHYLGTISYATYLVHFLLFYAFKLALVRDAHAVPPALIALYLALVFAASTLLHHLVERPAQRWLNAVPRRHGPLTPTGAPRQVPPVRPR